jgi:hypothetical protein
MARLKTIAVICAAVWLSGCPWRRPLNADESRVLREWLETTCALGQEARLRAELLSHAAALEPHLLAAFRDGPPAALLAQAESVAGARYDALSAYRARHRRPTPPPARPEFVARARAQFDRGYRAAALGGLGVIGSRDGVNLLKKLAGDKSSPDREAAADILDEHSLR